VDRCALFVDAGYALADGAMAVHGTRRLDSVSWDHSGLLKLLAGLARDRTGLPVLRCYWYETADGRSAEHDELAEMPGLKLRLVNTRPGRREGIESQLRRDIVTLAKSGAIADAFIASADEDLAEIVAEVQDLGLRVVILHIASDGGWTIPQPLRQECDDIVEISGVHLRPFVDLIQGAEPATSEEQFASAGYGSRAAANSDGSMTGAMRHSGLPAAALPAPAGAYPAPIGSDYGSAQPYANAGASQADAAAVYRAASQAIDASVRSDQAIFASRGPESDADPMLSAGRGQAGNAAQNDAAQAGADAQGGGIGQHAVPTGAGAQYASGSAATPQYVSAGAGTPQYGSAGGGTPQYASAGAGAPQHASQGPGIPQYGQSAGPGQHASQSQGTPQHASQGPGIPQVSQGAGVPQHATHGTPQHATHGTPQHASHGMPQHAAQGGAPQHAPAAGNVASASGSAYSASAQPGGGLPGSRQPGGGQGGSAQAGSAQAASPQSGGGEFGGGQTHISHNRTQDNSSLQSGYPDSGASGMHAQRGGHPNDGSYQIGATQNGAYETGTTQSGPAPGRYQNAAPRAGYQGGPGPAGSGPGMPAQSAFHLSGLTSYQAGSGQNGYPAQGSGSASNGTPAPGGHQLGYQNGSGHNGAPSYQDGPAQGGSGAYGSLSGYQPGWNQNGAPDGPHNGRAANGGAPHNAPAAFEPGSAPRPHYGAPDPGYFPAQPGAPGSAGTSGSHQRASTGYPASQMQPSEPSQPQHQPQPHEVSALPAVRLSQPVAISLPEAVKAAHSEGFSFGESVGRDAPGLWLEAVLARKPRMPSDLEARLLQGSVLPIDSLLHDEVRHSLRRGFWEALESARR
jgi:hypothetical protein